MPPGRHRGLPSPRLTLIFTLDEPLTLAGHPDPAQAPGTYSALLGGLHTRPALITHEGRQSGVQLGLHPLGARALLGLPAGELAGTAGTSTRPIWPGSSVRWPAVRPANGSPRSSETSKPRGEPSRKAEVSGPPGVAHPIQEVRRSCPTPHPHPRYGRRCGPAMPAR
ncbi:hypothetical protein [Streptomyces sioyaensis]|uniref:hypothetical protein n=1 Tax=Streptomyces sioyaensis TaxID=67364 RepID=UPI003D748204